MAQIVSVCVGYAKFPPGRSQVRYTKQAKSAFQMPIYARPTRLDQALQVLAGGDMIILAGGTDYYPAHVGTSLAGDILDISAIHSLRGITEHRGHWRIGATTTWTGVIESGLPPLFDGSARARSRRRADTEPRHHRG